MTVKIIGEDKQLVKVVSCSNCTSRLEYAPADTIVEKRTDYGGDTDSYRVLVCPKCRYKITVGYH